MERVDKKVSIIIPVYNAEKYLHENIKDLLRQTYPYFELIYVNDGSTDGSLDILQKYQSIDERIKIIVQKNTGAGNARNTGLSYVTGDYLLFLDADDRFEPELLEKAVSEAERWETDILIYDASCFDNETGQEVFSDWIIKKEMIPLKKVFSYIDIPDKIFLFTHSAAWNKLYRTSFIKKNYLFFQELPYSNDSYFVCLALLKAEKMVFLNAKLVNYRQNCKESLSGRGIRQKYPLCICEALSAIQDEMKKIGIYDSVWRSFANLAMEQLSWNLDILREEAFYSLFANIKNKFLRGYDIDKLRKEEFLREELYNKVKWIQQSDENQFLFYLLAEKNREIARFSRDVYKLCNEYDEMSDTIKRLRDIRAKKKWVFTDSRIQKGSRIILYGAGDMGKDYYEQFKRTEEYKLIAWVDQNYEAIRNEEKEIVSPEKIPDMEYDFIIIAVLDNHIANDIKNRLVTKGVIEEKIIWSS